MIQAPEKGHPRKLVTPPLQSNRATGLGGGQAQAPLSPARPVRPGGRGPLRFADALLQLLKPSVRARDFTYVSSGSTITITGYTGPGGAVVIPSTIAGKPVTTIGAYAFQDAISLTSVALPSSVTTIASGAFWGCSSLTRVILPGSVITIGTAVFNGCRSLTSVTIPSSVTTIGG